MKKDVPKISVIVPVHNEEPSLAKLASEIGRVFAGPDAAGMDLLEILFVDDGSSDDSWSTIERLRTETERIVALKLRKNFGKSAALQVGFDHASGDILVTIDADLQDDPAAIPRLVAKLLTGYDMVSGWKRRRQDPLSKTIPSKLFNFTVRRIFGTRLHDINCGLKAYRSASTKSLALYGEFHRFIPVILANKGYRIAEIEIEHRPRKHGRSNYGLERIRRGGLDFLSLLVLSRFSRRPGHFFGSIALLLGAAGFLILSYLSFLWFRGVHPIGNRPLFFMGILLLLLSAQSFAVGILAELINFHHQDKKSDELVETVSR